MLIRSIIALLLCLFLSVSLGHAQGPNQNPFGGVQRPQPKMNAQQQQAANEASRAAAIGMVVCVGVSVVFGIALKIFIILFIVKDAKKRGMDPTLWVILEIFVGLIGLIVYLCVREPLLSESRRRRDRDDEDYEDNDRPRRRRRNRDDDEIEDDEDRPRRRRDEES